MTMKTSSFHTSCSGRRLITGTDKLLQRELVVNHTALPQATYNEYMNKYDVHHTAYHIC